MRTFKITVALAAMLAMAGMAPAEGICVYHVTRTPGFSSSVLDSYRITLCSDVTAFRNINIVGEGWWAPPSSLASVHQVNQFGGFPSKAVRTLWLGEMTPESEPYDTHFMFAYDAGQVMTGNGTSETSTKNSSPTGISQDANGFYYGVGTLYSGAADGFILPEVLPAGSPFMQIVVPKGEGAWLTGMVVVNGEDALLYWEPEPSTVAMLIAGALCLVTFRFRKRARLGATG